MTKFRKVKLYQWKRLPSIFQIAQIYKDGKEHGTMAISDANQFCEKWNGQRGDWEIK